MKKVISASRRTDLVASFAGWLSQVIREGRAEVTGPRGADYSVVLSPEKVHTLVLWSKDFSNLIEDRFGLRQTLRRYAQLYAHFTITGLGGGPWERGAAKPETALAQLEKLIEVVEGPERVSVRFDPIVFWKDQGRLQTNLDFFNDLAPELASHNIRTVRISFAQWYRKAQKRAHQYGINFVDPEPEQKLESARFLEGIARKNGIQLYACSQKFLTAVPGIAASACIDGKRLQELHPEKAPVAAKKDRTQRAECLCTDSSDIGSYTQHCPQSCLYCYANPSL